MRATKPHPELPSTLHLRLALCDVALEVLCAGPARVQLGEQVHEAEEVVLLASSGLFGVGRSDAVEERPAGATEGFDIGRAVIGDGGGRCRGCWGRGSWVCDTFDEA